MDIFVRKPMSTQNSIYLWESESSESLDLSESSEFTWNTGGW